MAKAKGKGSAKQLASLGADLWSAAAKGDEEQVQPLLEPPPSREA